MKVISLCDLTGNIVRPWARAGYECICVDIEHPQRRERREGNIRFVWGDVRAWWPDSFDGVKIVFAQPPCTDLAASGSQDWKRKGLTRLIDALQLVESCRRICAASGKVWMMENPVGRLSTIWKNWDYSFDPCDYAGYLDIPAREAYTKKTCLWTGSDFVMPEHRRVDPVLGSKMHKLGPSKDRQRIRSATPNGFSRAVFLANNKGGNQ